MDYENNIQGLKTWLLTQEERLKRKPRIEDLTSVQNALNDCQVGTFAALCIDLLDKSHLVFAHLQYIMSLGFNLVVHFFKLRILIFVMLIVTALCSLIVV